jgi:hypothetical protein
MSPVSGPQATFTNPHTTGVSRHDRLRQLTLITHTNLVLRESLDDTLHHLLPWDIELVIDDPVDEPVDEPEV